MNRITKSDSRWDLKEDNSNRPSQTELLSATESTAGQKNRTFGLCMLVVSIKLIYQSNKLKNKNTVSLEDFSIGSKNVF